MFSCRVKENGVLRGVPTGDMGASHSKNVKFLFSDLTFRRADFGGRFSNHYCNNIDPEEASSIGQLDRGSV